MVSQSDTRIGILLSALVLIISLVTACGDDPNNASEDVPSSDVGMTFDMGGPGDDAGSVVDDGGPTDMRTPPDDLGFGFDVDDEVDTGPGVLRLDAVIPPRGPVDGGTPFVMNGSGFTPDTVVYFGSKRVDVELVGSDLVGETPATTSPGPVNVKVLDETSGDDLLTGGFEYVATVAVDEVTPSRLPTEGGIEVAVRGRGFDADTRVSFGGETGVRHTHIDAETMRVVAPPHARGDVDVRVTNAAGTAVLADGVSYYEALRVDTVRPATGVPSGGDTVTVSGADFEQGMSFEFDAVAAAVQSVNPAGTEAVVTTPAHGPGLVDVRAVTASGDAAVGTGLFHYAPAGAFELVRVEPDEGMTVGGSEVTVTGAGLDAGNLDVRFGGAPATILDQGPGHALVQIPAHAVGDVDVTVDDGADAATLPDGFTYVENLWIDRIDPAEGDVGGGYPVTIEGEGFTGATVVRFGGMAAAFTVDNDSEITATVPPRSAGVVDVIVERDSIDATFVDGFTYSEDVAVHGIYPVRGSIAGGTYVVLRGRGFVGDALQVTFGGVPATDLVKLDAQTMSVRAPAHAPAAVDVEVTRGAETATAPVPYTYFNPGTQFGGTWGGPVRGAVNVTVFAIDGRAVEDAFVMLSTNAATPYTGYTDANGMVTLSGPDVYGEQTISAAAVRCEQTMNGEQCHPYSSASIQRVNAENVTLYLYPRPPTGEPPPPPPTARFEGTITGLDKLAEPGPQEYQMAIVYVTQETPWSNNPDPGTGNVVRQDGEYTVVSRTGDVALVAVGGLYDEDALEFTPLRMGVRRGLFAVDDQTETADIDLDIPLDETLTFKLDHPPLAPQGPDTNRVVPYLDLGFEGVWPSISIAEGKTSVITAPHHPALTGKLSDAQYIAIGGSYPGLRDEPPMSVGIERNINDVSTVIDMPGLLPVAQMTSPSEGQLPIDRLFAFQASVINQPDLWNVRMFTPRGIPVWEVFLPGDETSFRLPDFPEFTALPQNKRPEPYKQGQYVLDIRGYEIPGFSYENLSYQDVRMGSIDAYSAYSSIIQF